MSDTRIVIDLPGMEAIGWAVSLLVAAQAKRIAGRSRRFAVDGPVVTSTQVGALAELAGLDAILSPAWIPDSWTVVDVPDEEIPEMEEGEAMVWWDASYRDAVSPR
ncbi:hypothetical protein Sme01_03410 [Sphaerisporangium melleum]|uniref:Uncharacterized protein n=1 Tax=Sphaerisporangium melleum TaxID=321316 RepID=A0A917VBJ7_9ACTN|nr:hypothetical protein [Sphaerisporangium melleum]GGK61651.1 hypothetical protein GCM10007964_00960 [Sphaerisporangium melleum]GII67865.1 hypothetical protein Sme01_03410 [Sphaerisporangium melleum]